MFEYGCETPFFSEEIKALEKYDTVFLYKKKEDSCIG